MGDIRYDSTFAFRIAAAKKIVRYNGRICQSCEKIYDSAEPKCPFCHGQKPLAKAIKAKSATAKKPLCASPKKEETVLCGHCENRMPVSALADHLLRKHRTSINVEPPKERARQDQRVAPAVSINGRPRITREIDELERNPLKDVIAHTKPIGRSGNSALPANASPHQAQVLAKLERHAKLGFRGIPLVQAVARSLGLKPKKVRRIIEAVSPQLL